MSKLKLQQSEFKSRFHLVATVAWTSRTDAQQVTCNPRYVSTQRQALALNYTNRIVWRWGRGMLKKQRASPDSRDLHADSSLQPVIGATPQRVFD
jgi:hypothetical protein